MSWDDDVSQIDESPYYEGQMVSHSTFGAGVVVRLEGTNVDTGRELLANSGLDIIAAEDLTDAAKKVVAAAT